MEIRPLDPNQDTWRIFRIMAEFVEGFEVMSKVGPAVTIFGSARTPPTDRYFKDCVKLGGLLARDGYAVITGGGPGIMEAGNMGAFEAGGTSVGLNIFLPHEQQSNKYQNVRLDFHYFYARKVMFTKYAGAFVCFPGGFGTLDEFFENVTLIQTMKMESYPVLLYGKAYWSGLLDWINQTLAGHFIDKEDIGIMKVVDSPEEAAQLIRKHYSKPWWKPSKSAMSKFTGNGNTLRKSPLMHDPRAQSTGEGTRYGQRPKKSSKTHVKAKGKPQQ